MIWIGYRRFSGREYHFKNLYAYAGPVAVPMRPLITGGFILSNYTECLHVSVPEIFK